MDPAIGKNVDAWCGRCKLLLAHTIEAMVSAKITRVHCNTCGAQHAFKPNAPGSGRAKTTRSRSSSESKGTDYASMIRAKDESKARPYAMTQRYKVDELLRHPTFGVGLVMRVRDNTKIEVGFEQGLKVLAQAAQ